MVLTNIFQVELLPENDPTNKQEMLMLSVESKLTYSPLLDMLDHEENISATRAQTFTTSSLLTSPTFFANIYNIRSLNKPFFFCEKTRENLYRINTTKGTNLFSISKSIESVYFKLDIILYWMLRNWNKCASYNNLNVQQ